jgi:hypothetical protein
MSDEFDPSHNEMERITKCYLFLVSYPVSVLVWLWPSGDRHLPGNGIVVRRRCGGRASRLPH